MHGVKASGYHCYFMPLIILLTANFAEGTERVSRLNQLLVAEGDQRTVQDGSRSDRALLTFSNEFKVYVVS